MMALLGTRWHSRAVPCHANPFAHYSTRDVGGVIRQVLGYTRSGGGQRRQTDLVTVIDRAVAAARRG